MTPCRLVQSRRQQTAVAGVAPHAKKRRSVKIAISGPKARRATRRSFQFMRTGQTEVDRETPSDKKEGPPMHWRPQVRGNDASHHRGIVGTIGFSKRTVL